MTKHYLCGIFFKTKQYYFGILSLLVISVISFTHLYLVGINYNTLYVSLDVMNKTPESNEFCSKSNLIEKFNQKNGSSETVVVFNILLYLSCLIPGGLSTFSNPGFLRPKFRHNHNYTDRSHINNKGIFTIIKGRNYRLKYCITCKLIRSPTTSHCKHCDVCIDRYDHHCPWIGNCIGKLNYRQFIFFIGSLSAQMFYISLTTSIKLSKLINFKNDSNCLEITYIEMPYVITLLIISTIVSKLLNI